ncbi:MAG TPA: ATP-binding cassette domain-containing protein, partial [Trueperaceae bacterium]
EEARPRALSGGMQQRVGLARALCTDPEILLMDEPFSALDPLIRREMQDELIRLQQELHKTIVFITHDLDEALRLGDRVAILKHGRLVQVGTPQDILMRPADDYVEAFIQDVNRSRILTAEGAMESPVRAMLRDTPDQVAKRLRSEDRRTAFITDEGGHYRGIVTLEIAQAAARNGKRQVADIVEESAPTVEQDTPLQELFGLAADSGVPLAVLDERGSLQGILRPAAILDALATRDIPHVTPEESTKEVVGS